MNDRSIHPKSPYNGGLTREQFCFHEMRCTAALLCEGLPDGEVIDRITRENLFQYPTERMLKNLASVCVRRLRAMKNEPLIEAAAHQPADTAKQVCLYAMMKDNRLVWDFMLTVVAEKFRQRQFSLSRADMNLFFLRLQEQDDTVAGWSAATITKIGQVLRRALIENSYLDGPRSERLNPVLISRVLEEAIRAAQDERALPAFNCFD